MDEVVSNEAPMAARAAGATLAAASGQGPDGFDAFYRREMPRLVALARGLCGSPVADDLAQEAMLAALSRWDDVSRLDSPAGWVRRVCANRATSLLRRRSAEARALVRLRARPRDPAPELEPRPAEFWSEVRRLPRRQAQAAALHYLYDLSVADVAATMGCSVGAVKVHLGRARAALAERFAADEEALS